MLQPYYFCYIFLHIFYFPLFVLRYTDIVHLYAACVGIEAPTVAGNTMDTVGVADMVVHIHHHHGVVIVDIYAVGVICGGWEGVAVDVGNKALAVFSLLLEVDFASCLALGIKDQRVVHTGVCL